MKLKKERTNYIHKMSAKRLTIGVKPTRPQKKLTSGKGWRDRYSASIKN